MDYVSVYHYKWKRCVNELCIYDKVNEHNLMNCMFCNKFVSRETKFLRTKESNIHTPWQFRKD